MNQIIAVLALVALTAGCDTPTEPEPGTVEPEPTITTRSVAEPEPVAVESEPTITALEHEPELFDSTVPPLTYDTTVEPKNIPQLRRSIDRAYSAYEGQLRDLMRERGEELHGIAAAHELIGQQADDAYEAFQAEQKRLQDAFNATISQ